MNWCTLLSGCQPAIAKSSAGLPEELVSQAKCRRLHLGRNSRRRCGRYCKTQGCCRTADSARPLAPAIIPAAVKGHTPAGSGVCDTCGYVATRRWLNSAGAPLCPKHGQMNVQIIEIILRPHRCILTCITEAELDPSAIVSPLLQNSRKRCHCEVKDRFLKTRILASTHVPRGQILDEFFGYMTRPLWSSKKSSLTSSSWRP